MQVERRPRVLVTRAAGQSSKLADALRERGIEPVVVPTIAIEPYSDLSALDTALAKLEQDDWVVATSINGVEPLAQRWFAVDASERPEVHFAAIGVATAEAMNKAGLPVKLVPAKATGAGLARELQAYLERPDGERTRFLIVRAEKGAEGLPEALKEARARLLEVPVYRTVLPESSVEAVKAVFADPQAWPDAVTFTSGSSVENLVELLDKADLELPPQVLRIAIGPTTAEVMHAIGYPAHKVAGEASIAALVDCVDIMLQKRFTV